MSLACAFKCSEENSSSGKPTVVRHGVHYRSSDRKRLVRYRCIQCRRTFTRESGSVERKQKVRGLARILWELQASGVSQNRLALIFGLDRKTVVRKIRGLANHARSEHRTWQLAEGTRVKREKIQFDDLETAEHTKCKPLSVALAVDPETRKILSFQVSRMPAKGKLAAVARKKYGKRDDERGNGWNRMFEELKPMVSPQVDLLSDQNPHYPAYVRKHLAEATHHTVKSRRGCIAGQGELKKIGFDPLFSLNHTCAMFRANVNRLFRRTWCISKTVRGLEDHLFLYTVFHNQRLTEKGRKVEPFRLHR